MSNDDYVLEVPAGFLMSDEAAMDTEGSSGSTHFGALRLYIKAVTPYLAGQHFTIPGVFQYREDKASETWLNEGLKQFKGFTLGGKSRLFIMVSEETNKNEQKYQRVKVFKSWKEKDKDFDPPVVHFEWQTHELPAIRQLPADVVTSFEAGKIIYAKYEVLPTGRKFKRQGEEGESGATYWGDFQLHPSWDALMAAKKDHFGQFGANGVNGTVAAGVDLSNFPEIWHNKDNPAKGQADLFAQIRTVQGGKFIEKAKEVMLIGPNGQPVKRLGKDEPVNLGELFAQALDVALTEDIAKAFEHLYK